MFCRIGGRLLPLAWASQGLPTSGSDRTSLPTIYSEPCAGSMSEKFQKAFRLMLSTTHPGECVAARDGLVKIAKTNGHDIHQLVAVLAKALTTVIPGDKPEPDPPEPNDHRDKAEYIWE